MPRFAANISALFAALPYQERFEAALKAGFTAIEIADPYEYCLFATKRKLWDAELALVLINLPAGNTRLGEKGIAANPHRQEEFRAGVEVSIRWACELGVQRVNCLAGLRQEQYSFTQQCETLLQNLAYAANRFAKYGISLVVDIGSPGDDPNRLLRSYEMAAALQDAVQAKNISLLLQVCQMRSPYDNRALLRQYVRQAGHVRVAPGVCARQRQDAAINLIHLLEELDALGYAGYVSLENRQAADLLMIPQADGSLPDGEKGYLG